MRRQRSEAGVALLVVLSAITILALVLIQFSSGARTHMNSGVNMRDELRATTLGDTALVLTRACLDPKAWGPLAAVQSKVELEKLCNLMLGILVRGRLDLPIGGLSVELQGIEGVGLSRGEIEEITLTPEEAFIGLGGLYCAGRAQIGCPSQRAAIGKLRALLCDPRIAHVFESEQADGHQYTREEVIGNLIDWVDADDNRVNIDPLNGWAPIEGAGEGEDSYLRDSDDRYRSKDGPFDSVFELKMIRGINDELFYFLKDKVSVYGSGKINVNHASAEVIAKHLQAYSPAFQNHEAGLCGEEVETTGLEIDDLFQMWAGLLVKAREAKTLCAIMSGNIVGKAFKNARAFERVAKDPLPTLKCLIGDQIDEETFLAGVMGRPDGALIYTQLRDMIASNINWRDLKKNIETKTSIFRLEVRGTVGNMTRTTHAVLKKDGQTIRTLYYREE